MLRHLDLTTTIRHSIKTNRSALAEGVQMPMRGYLLRMENKVAAQEERLIGYHRVIILILPCYKLDTPLR